MQAGSKKLIGEVYSKEILDSHLESVGGDWCSRLFAKQEPIKLGEVRFLRSPRPAKLFLLTFDF